MAYFDFAGEVEVSVTFNRGDIRTARVRPSSSFGVIPELRINGRMVRTSEEAGFFVGEHVEGVRFVAHEK